MGAPEYAVIDLGAMEALFAGQSRTELGVGNRLLLAEDKLRDNLRAVQERNDIEAADPAAPPAVGALGEGLLGPPGPLRILGHDVEQDVAVGEDGQRSLRVSARISSVVIRTDPRPRSRPTIDFPRRPARPARRTLRMRTALPTTSNSTSVSGSRRSYRRATTLHSGGATSRRSTDAKPARSRLAAGSKRRHWSL